MNCTRSMSEQYTREILKYSIAALCKHSKFTAIEDSVLEFLCDLIIECICLISRQITFVFLIVHDLYTFMSMEPAADCWPIMQIITLSAWQKSWVQRKSWYASLRRTISVDEIWCLFTERSERLCSRSFMLCVSEYSYDSSPPRTMHRGSKVSNRE